jgi:hypothetical protein
MIAFAFIVLLLVSACCAPQHANTPIDMIALAVVTWFTVNKGWRVRRGSNPEDKHLPAQLFKEFRHRQAFIFYRTRRLLEDEANAEWRTEPDHVSLKSHLENGLQQLEQFTTELVGTMSQRGPLFGGSDASVEHHLDLGMLCTSIREGDPPPVTIPEAIAARAPDDRQRRVLEALDRRRDRALGIAWRAAGIESEFWDQRANGERWWTADSERSRCSATRSMQV